MHHAHLLCVYSPPISARQAAFLPHELLEGWWVMAGQIVRPAYSRLVDQVKFPFYSCADSYKHGNSLCQDDIPCSTNTKQNDLPRSIVTNLVDVSLDKSGCRCSRPTNTATVLAQGGSPVSLGSRK